MNEQIQLPNKKIGIRWTHKERPSINHWYMLINEEDYWKIVKDFHSPERKVTYYKIVEYYNGDFIYVGKTLSEIREIVRNNTYRMVI